MNFFEKKLLYLFTKLFFFLHNLRHKGGISLEILYKETTMVVEKNYLSTATEIVEQGISLGGGCCCCTCSCSC